MRKTTFATQSRFHTNPCKFRDFQTVVKYFVSEFTRSRMENHPSVTGWQELFFSNKSFSFPAAVAVSEKLTG